MPTTSRDRLSQEFQCRNGKYINKSKVCDASNDCEDESDEHPPLCPGNDARMLIEPDDFTGQSIMQWMLKLPRESFYCMLDSSGTMKLPLRNRKFRGLRVSTLFSA